MAVVGKLAPTYDKVTGKSQLGGMPDSESMELLVINGCHETISVENC